jgi:cathepsin A (carboxypeptidase C)
MFTNTVVLCLLLVGVALGATADEEIINLPGWSPKPLPSKQYSGFVDSNSEGTLKMHYWFIESEADPATAPLLLWFNGGPGASSLYGLLLELGPFMVSL